MGPKHLLHRDHPVTRHLAWVPIPVTILLVATVWSHQLLPPALRDTLLGDGNAGIAQLGSFGSELTRGLLAVARAERDSEERRAVKLEVLELLRAHMWVPTIATLLYVSLVQLLSLIHISEPTRLLSISYAVFCLKKKKKRMKNLEIK
eukprot:TRINITY_DN29267_c0_g1_i1.p1 TRINITY_DN29267_c0_g1~~TRINITY_DN29267_c0_g1_i1.p1  ORF type:complete len:148 (+),score=29.09 TRINITY_DN29267_c0_g1_i1:246-689(+)